ncbi:MAG: hypothetical protein S4CHLAM37_04150 [Chlamydiia bacterium]|nr:hypothetical protein [Chlamydiia bacterium]
MKTITFAKECFDKLQKAAYLYIHVKDLKGQDCIGYAEVSVLKERSVQNEIVLLERGYWQKGKEKISFTNRVQFVLKDSSLFVSHLRYEKHSPKFLVELFSKDTNLLSTKEPHLCNKDCYVAKMSVKDDSLFLGWKILGPSKDQEICLRYTSKKI